LLELGQRVGVVCVGEIISDAAPSLFLSVALSPPRAKRAEWAVEKLTELGVAEIIWLKLARTPDRAAITVNRADRLDKIAAAAARQCGRATTPRCNRVISLGELLAMEFDARFLAAQNGLSVSQLGSKRPDSPRVNLLIGAEGGVTDQEVEHIVAAGYTSVCFGNHTLRSETAAVAGAALLLTSL